MDRRELLKMIALLTGGAVVGGEVFLSGCTNTDSGATTGVNFSQADISYLDEIGETILPATKTPGAKAAKVGQFMTVIVRDCYEEKDQKIFREGMSKINDESKKAYEKKFMDITPQQRLQLLTRIDQDSKTYQQEKRDYDMEQDQKEKAAMAKGDTSYHRTDMPNHPTHYFTLFKQLTLWGYFTSKEGITKALRWTPVPARYDACIPYNGEPAFAKLG